MSEAHQFEPNNSSDVASESERVSEPPSPDTNDLNCEEAQRWATHAG